LVLTGRGIAAQDGDGSNPGPLDLTDDIQSLNKMTDHLMEGPEPPIEAAKPPPPDVVYLEALEAKLKVESEASASNPPE
jgi:hypothetical protein